MVYHAPIDTTHERCWLKYKLIYNETDRLGYLKYVDKEYRTTEYPYQYHKAGANNTFHAVFPG